MIIKKAFKLFKRSEISHLVFLHFNDLIRDRKVNIHLGGLIRMINLIVFIHFYIVVTELGLLRYDLVRILVHQAVIVNVVDVFVEFVNNWEGIWNLVLFDVFIADALQVFENGSKTVFMGHYDNFLVVHYLSHDLVLPERYNSINCIF